MLMAVAIIKEIPKDKPVINWNRIPMLRIYGAGLASAKIYSALTTPAVLPYLEWNWSGSEINFDWLIFPAMKNANNSAKI